mmetsp:Transcript_2801/g.3132  ORF Transcript_2801/g.3132 Transcript_2801/m.3132 type:complete len:600 (+) Transcript_2801:394-2193(+)
MEPHMKRSSTSSLSSSSSSSNDSTNYNSSDDSLLLRLQKEAQEISTSEPALSCMLHRTVLHPDATTFEKAVAIAVSHRLSVSVGSTGGGCGSPDLCPNVLQDIFLSAVQSKHKEAGHVIATALAQDALAYVRRDPACDTLLEPILFFKGYAAVVCHRVAHIQWHLSKTESKRKSFVSLWIQSQASSAFGVDIHPAAAIGCGLMLDHATGIVVGETASIGDGCTLLHGVTLGGTGKDKGRDRHPKVGHHVLIGAGTQVLGNISVGDGAKIGAGSVVLRPVPHGTTAVGVPARIVGWAKEKYPGSSVDVRLLDVVSAVGAGDEEDGNDDNDQPAPSLQQEDNGEDGKTVSTESLTTFTSFPSSQSSDQLSSSTSEADSKEEEEHDDEAELQSEQEIELTYSTTSLDRNKPKMQHSVSFKEEKEANNNGEDTKQQHTTSKLERRIKIGRSLSADATSSISMRKSLFRCTNAPEEDIFCPYRDFFCGSSSSASSNNSKALLSPLYSSPKEATTSPEYQSNKGKNVTGIITFPKLQHYLQKEGATNCQVGETFMELLKRDYNVHKKRQGYVTFSVFETEFVKVAEKYTDIGRERLEMMMKEEMV